jgi:hypothetical protein
MDDPFKSPVADGIRHSSALRRAVCTTSPVYCPYRLTQDTNPHSVPPSLLLFETECYIYTTHQPLHFDPEDGVSMYLRNFGNRANNNSKAELTQMSKYSSQLLQYPAFGRCPGTVRPFFASVLMYCTSHPEVSPLLHEWSNFGSLKGLYEGLGTQLLNL